MLELHLGIEIAKDSREQAKRNKYYCSGCGEEVRASVGQIFSLGEDKDIRVPIANIGMKICPGCGKAETILGRDSCLEIMLGRMLLISEIDPLMDSDKELENLINELGKYWTNFEKILLKATTDKFPIV